MLFGSTDITSAPVVMAIKIASTPVVAGEPSNARTKTVGIAFADTSSRELGVADFVDNDLFSNTEVSVFPFIASPLSLKGLPDSGHSASSQRSDSSNRDAVRDHGARC